MAKDPKIQASANVEQSAEGWNRRRLLKAAAATAPIIATLPSGAALANASTQQCVITSREASNNLPLGQGGDWIEPDNNPFVRMTAILQTATILISDGLSSTLYTRKYYLINFGGTELHYVGDYTLPNFPDQWDDVPQGAAGANLNRPPEYGGGVNQGFPAGDGKPGFDFTGGLEWLEDWTKTTEVERNVLVTFKESGENPEEAMDGVYFTGFWPNKMRGEVAGVDNMGVTSSCLCSVDPDFRDVWC